MIIDHTHEDYESNRLVYGVMGIALAIWGALGECDLFREIDRALDRCDEPALRIFENAFHSLPAEAQDIINSGEEKPEALQIAIAQFERALRRQRTIAAIRPA